MRVLFTNPVTRTKSHFNAPFPLQGPFDEDLDDEATAAVGDLVEKLALGSSGKLNPVAAFLGGLVGHEVIKASSGKYKPLSQFAHFDFVEALSDAPVVEADCAPCGSRYDGQIAVFGKALQAKIAALSVFMVGAGALGCEFIKNFALMVRRRFIIYSV